MLMRIFDFLFPFCLGGLVGWTGGYCFGWLVGTKDTERRWSDAVGRKESDDWWVD